MRQMTDLKKISTIPELRWAIDDLRTLKGDALAKAAREIDMGCGDVHHELSLRWGTSDNPERSEFRMVLLGYQQALTAIMRDRAGREISGEVIADMQTYSTKALSRAEDIRTLYLDRNSVGLHP